MGWGCRIGVCTEGRNRDVIRQGEARLDASEERTKYERVKAAHGIMSFACRHGNN